MPNKEDIELMSHLMRRAGFGTTRDEIEQLAEQGYEATVEQLLNPESQPALDEDPSQNAHGRPPIVDSPLSLAGEPKIG